MATTPPDDGQFEQILQHLQQTRGFDFSSYKRASLMRRVLKRMQAVNVATFEEYYDYLQVHQEEFAPLFNTILINVTSFFRDAEVWQYLRDHALPPLLDRPASAGPVRVWSAGCASGEEPYSLAMLMAELVGSEALRDRVKIYATDADEEALAEARLAVYSPRAVADLPEAFASKYFENSGAQYTVSRELRRAIIFGRHDLLQDAPISRVDLLLCRNTLMYFNSDAQARILARLFFALNPEALIVLGRAEMLFSHAAMFAPVDLKRRVFRGVPKPNQRDRLLLIAQTGRDVMSQPAPNHSRLKEAAFDADLVPHVILDPARVLTAANAPARARLGLTVRDIGRPLQDLEFSYRPVEIRGAIDQAIEARKEVTIADVQLPIDGEPRIHDITIAPIVDEEGVLLGTRVSFHDVTEYRALQTELQHSKQELETAYEELQSTNEELETTNEELQSTVEELETTNEELQSTNEELETMNEELQSTNEELQTMNDELRSRTTDLNVVNDFLASVFGSLRSAVVVIDREFRVQVWNDRAADLWGVRDEEALGGHFLSLDIGLPVSELRGPIRDVLVGGKEFADLTLAATNRRGRAIECRVALSPLRDRDRTPSGVILLMEDVSQGATAT